MAHAGAGRPEAPTPIGGSIQCSESASRLRRELIGIERKVIHELRDAGDISDVIMLRIDRELDLNETRVET